MKTALDDTIDIAVKSARESTGPALAGMIKSPSKQTIADSRSKPATKKVLRTSKRLDIGK